MRRCVFACDRCGARQDVELGGSSLHGTIAKLDTHHVNGKELCRKCAVEFDVWFNLPLANGTRAVEQLNQVGISRDLLRFK